MKVLKVAEGRMKVTRRRQTLMLVDVQDRPAYTVAPDPWDDNMSTCGAHGVPGPAQGSATGRGCFRRERTCSRTGRGGTRQYGPRKAVKCTWER